MADEAQGGAEAVTALFEPAPSLGEGAEANAPQEGVQGVSGASEDESWRPGFVPKAFRGEDGTFNGNQDAVFKSWYDGRQRITGLEAQLAELQKVDVPETADEYVNTFDFDAFKERAPRAYAGGGADNPIIADMLKLGHKHGVPVAKMQAVVTDYFAGINEFIPEAKDEPTALRETAAYLGPNGTQMMEDLKGKLAAHARRYPLGAEKLDAVKRILQDGPATAVLYELIGGRSGVVPPSAAASQMVDPEQEKREVAKQLGTLDESEWRRNKDAIIARWTRAHPEAA